MSKFIKEKDSTEKTVVKNTEYQSTRISLADQDQRTLIQALAKIIEDGRKIVIPIGFPAAGKSLFLSSLMYYAQNYPGKKWQGNALNEGVFKQGNMSRNKMINFFDEQEAYPQTDPGTLDLIGIDIEPENKNLPILPLAFIDLAGDDIRQIKVDEKGEFGRQIEGILKACEDTTPVFCMLTPYKPIKGNDSSENQLHINFLNYLYETMPDLYNNSKFIFIVSQWDKKPKTVDLDVETFIETKRPALHNATRGRKKSDICYGEFSVGKLTDTYKNVKRINEEGKEVEIEVATVLITRIDSEYPGKFWENLYQLITGKSLLPGGCLAKLFGF
jgi:hypothetical protein